MADRSAIGLVANLGVGAPPNGQTLKSRQLLGLLERSGRLVEVVDVGEKPWRLFRLVPMVLRGQALLVVLNRKGLWAALALAGLFRRLARHRTAVLVAVVGGWLPDVLASSRACRRLSRVADEYLAETPDLVDALRRTGLVGRELVNFRALPVEVGRVRSAPNDPLRLCFASRVRFDKGVVLAAEVVVKLEASGVPSRLDIWGPVEEEDALRAASALPGVTYRGVYGSPEEALGILSAYDFLVLPTSYDGECMPGVVVEACFAALPAVVSSWRDLDHLVVDGVTGYVCPLDGFVDAAAQRIVACLEGGDLAALSRNALEHAASRFTEEASRTVLLDAIDDHETATRGVGSARR